MIHQVFKAAGINLKRSLPTKGESYVKERAFQAWYTSAGFSTIWYSWTTWWKHWRGADSGQRRTAPSDTQARTNLCHQRQDKKQQRKRIVDRVLLGLTIQKENIWKSKNIIILSTLSLREALLSSSGWMIQEFLWWESFPERLEDEFQALNNAGIPL